MAKIKGSNSSPAQVDNKEYNGQFPTQTSKEFSIFTSDIMENQNVSSELDKLGIPAQRVLRTLRPQ